MHPGSPDSGLAPRVAGPHIIGPQVAGPQLEIIVRRGAGPSDAAPIVLVHGAWHGAWCWDEGFAQRLASRGHDVHAVSLRGHGGSGGRRNLWRTRIRDYVEDVARVVETLDRAPVLVGHSMGGFVIQKYLETRAAAAAVLLAPMPYFGMAACMLRLLRIDPVAVLRMHATLGHRTMATSPGTARRLFFSPAMSDAAVRRHQERLRGEAFLAYLDMLVLDRCRPRAGAAPTLVLGAGEDAVFTRREVEATSEAHGAALEFVPGMAHDMMLEPGWDRVADRIADWAAGLGEAPRPAPAWTGRDTAFEPVS